MTSRFEKARVAAGLSPGQVAVLLNYKQNVPYYRGSDITSLEVYQASGMRNLDDPKEHTISKMIKDLADIYDCGVSYLDGTFTEGMLSDYIKTLDGFEKLKGVDREIMIQNLMMIKSREEEQEVKETNA